MKKSDWGLEIRCVQDGFIVKDNEGLEYPFQEKEEGNEVDVALDLLRFIIEFFNLRGSRYDRRRVLVIEEVGDKYALQEGEKLKGEEYFIVEKK